MHAVRSQCQDEINPIVDEHQRTSFADQAEELTGQVHQRSGPKVLLPQLNGAHADSQGLTDGSEQRPTEGLVTVSDQIEGKINARHQRRTEARVVRTER
jgi:hypothetical protein